MKKLWKIILVFIIAFFLYAGLYYLIVLGAKPEEYVYKFGLFLSSVIFGFLGIILGLFLIWYFYKIRLKKEHSNALFLMISVLWGALFGWLTVSGLILGSIIAEKDEKDEGKEKGAILSRRNKK